MERINGEYFLNAQERSAFIRSVLSPDKSVMCKRDSYFARIDSSMQIMYADDGSMLIDIPEIQPHDEECVVSFCTDTQFTIELSDFLAYCHDRQKNKCLTVWSDISNRVVKSGRCLLCATM